MRKTPIIICIFILALLCTIQASADSVNTPPPITDTTKYDQYYPYNSWASYALSGSTDKGNLSVIRLNGSLYHAIKDPSNTILPNVKLYEGDSLNYTFTLKSGETVTGWMAKTSTGWFNSKMWFSMDGQTTEYENSKVLVFDIGTTFLIQHYVYNYGHDDEQYAVGCQNGGLIVKPIKDRNDTITSVYFKVNTGNPEVSIIEHYYDGRITNSNGANWVTDANGTAVQVDEPNNNDAIQKIIEQFTSLYGAVASLFYSLLFAVQVIAIIIVFFLDPKMMMLCLLLVELGCSAVIFNGRGNIFKKIQKYGSFNLALFEALLGIAGLLINFFYLMLDILAKLPDILAKVINAATDVVSKIVDIGIKIGTLLLLIPK